MIATTSAETEALESMSKNEKTMLLQEEIHKFSEFFEGRYMGCPIHPDERVLFGRLERIYAFLKPIDTVTNVGLYLQATRDLNQAIDDIHGAGDPQNFRKRVALMMTVSDRFLVMIGIKQSSSLNQLKETGSYVEGILANTLFGRIFRALSARV